MRPPADLPLELVLLAEAFARRLNVPATDFWAIVYRKMEPPPGWAATWAEAFEPLTSYPNDAKVSAQVQMETTRARSKRDSRPTLPAPVLASTFRKVGRPLDAAHPFPAALSSANITVTEWAASHGYKRARVKSWYAEGSGGRPVPRDAAEVISRELGVPATPRVWKNGIRD